LLAPHGLLYLGHSECRIGSHAGLASWNKRFPAAFTLAKSPTVSELPAWNPPVTVPKREAPWPAPKIEQAWSRRPAATPARATSSVSAPSTAPDPQRAVQTEAAVDELSLARGLANRGRLQEAEALCQRLQLKDPYNADLLCLLGVIQQAYGNMTLAESCYQKALFVSPNHEESLTHLMLLHQLRGESAQAMNYQRRLDLAKNRGS